MASSTLPDLSQERRLASDVLTEFERAETLFYHVGNGQGLLSSLPSFFRLQNNIAHACLDDLTFSFKVQ